LRERPVQRPSVADEDAPDLEHADALHFARLVVAKIADQRSDERRAHHRLLARDRIEEAHRIRLAGEIELPLRLDEREVDHFAIVRGGEALAQVVQAAPLG